MPFHAFAAAAAALLLSAPAMAEKLPLQRSEMVEGTARIEVRDLTPRFLKFYEAAEDESDPDRRFALWQEHYGFAAVPPGPRGEQIAREMLDEAWPRYGAEIGRLRKGAAVFGDEPVRILQSVARVLEAEGPLDLQFNAYVGAFEDNAFVAGADGRPIVNFPVEMAAEKVRPIMAHEFTHAVHMKLAGLSGGWERTIAATLVQEGLAMHVAREIVPGRSDAFYVEHEDGWWPKAQERKGAILQGILPALEAKDSDNVFRFTMGQGPAGLEREAYATGWWVIEQLRRDGMSLAEIARVPEEEMPELARRAIRGMVRS